MEYKMTIAGLERELPICTVNEKLDILSTIRTFKLLLKVLEEYCSI